MTDTQPYGTPDQPRLAVHGEAHLEVDPELAGITITIATRGTDRRATLDDLTRRNAYVIDLIKTYGTAVDKLETGAFTLTPQLARHGRGERVRTYNGSVRITTELTDFTALGELTTRLADLELTRVDGPWWSLRRDSPAYGDVRRRAVQQAVARAREYADALGTSLAALVELSDPGADNPTPGYGRPAGGGMAFRAAAPGAAPEPAPALDLEPQRQSVHARVNARFIMTPPTL
ncbi:SIMPL domain-containing protein [Streptomyces sp. NBC_00083]|uniref:SIMPL domain-containing protein n=1 Tax=Streptomyces sp. NBC_00083 TaxID=2975647 RepID=UPI0022593952|nr:SIMPL domain-containing protein [Streptomyces sp. NBC_00083]MCX5383067.1 SIMPL domain-containing protein [Streptomyces sp. NBC_00083]